MNDVLYFFFKEMKHLFQKCPLCPKTLRDRWRTRKNDEYGKAADSCWALDCPYICKEREE